VARALGAKGETPDAIAEIMAAPGGMDQILQYETEHAHELRKLSLEMEYKALSEVNQTFRAEVVAGDKFVRRWRPFFGYIVASTWGMQGVGIALLIIGLVFGWVPDPAAAVDAVAKLIAALATQWGVALAVLGVSTVQRSRDKARMMGHPLGGLLAGLVNKVSR
jgi:hypothetical protein